MKEIIESLHEHKLHKDIKTLLYALQPFVKSSDVKQRFWDLYKKGYITYKEFIFFDTRIVLGDFCLGFEKQSDLPIHMSVWLYDEKQNKMFFGAGPSVAPDVVEFINGRDVGPDADRSFDYRNNVYMIEDVTTDPRLENYRDVFRKNKYHSVITTPIHLKGKIVGNLDAYFTEAIEMKDKYINKVKELTFEIDKRLYEIKSDMIDVIKDKQKD